MQNKLLAFFILVNFPSCEQLNNQNAIEKDDLFFQTLISPAFDEHAEVTISKIDTAVKIQFLLRDATETTNPQILSISRRLI